jgi:crossover junction endodeoxyribonuclease RuvC
LSRILGIDPGLHITGWGVVDYDGFRLRHVGHGKIETSPQEEIGRRLRCIFQQLSAVVEEYAPKEACIEEIFVNMNPASSLKLGMARGAVICCAGMCGLEVAEYTPNRIKKSIVGVGHATKEQVSLMVQKLLNCGSVKLDAADALAVAVCHAHHRVSYKVIA